MTLNSGHLQNKDDCSHLDDEHLQTCSDTNGFEPFTEITTRFIIISTRTSDNNEQMGTCAFISRKL